jgi:hypothetical protein
MEQQSQWINGAIIQSIGQLEKKSEKLSKCEVVILIEDRNEVMTVGCAHWHRASLTVNASYDLLIADDGYGMEIKNIKNGKAVSPSKTATAQAPKPQAAPTPAPVSPKPVLKPDLPSRWREWNMHARTAQMTGTEFVGYKVQLAIAGKLGVVGEKGLAVVDLITEVTLENWRIEAIESYWKDYEARIPQDAWGDLGGDAHA